MNKSVLTHLVVLVVAVLLGWYLAQQLRVMQKNMFPSKHLISSAPIGGFHKFASDVEWMLFINYMGSLKSVEKDNCDEVVKRLEKIVSFDPNFDKAYQVGVLSISVASPEQAVNLLKKACANPDLKDNWKLPFYAGFILTHCMSDDQRKDPEFCRKRAEEAVPYLNMAVKRSSKPENYVINSYLRARAKSKSNLTQNNEKLALLKILYEDEWKKQKDTREMVEMSSIPDLHQRILKTAQEIREEFPDDKASKEFIKVVLEDVFSNQHICMKCLILYAAGDKFCAACGNDVPAYGTCRKCSTVLKGQYCHACGTKEAKKEEPKRESIPTAKVEPVKKDAAPAKTTEAAKGKK